MPSKCCRLRNKYCNPLSEENFRLFSVFYWKSISVIGKAYLEKKKNRKLTKETFTAFNLCNCIEELKILPGKFQTNHLEEPSI